VEGLLRAEGAEAGAEPIWRWASLAGGKGLEKFAACANRPTKFFPRKNSGSPIHGRPLAAPSCPDTLHIGDPPRVRIPRGFVSKDITLSPLTHLGDDDSARRDRRGVTTLIRCPVGWEWRTL
jgi:hypothetical protein